MSPVQKVTAEYKKDLKKLSRLKDRDWQSHTANHRGLVAKSNSKLFAGRRDTYCTHCCKIASKKQRVY